MLFLFNRLKQRLLNSSGTFNHYKENIELLNTQVHNLNKQIIELKQENNELSKKLNNKSNSLNKEIKSLKKKTNQSDKVLTKKLDDTDKVLTSYNKQFSTIFLYSDIKIVGLLRYTQILNQELLNFAANVCKKYDLEYWLDFGLLLGAVRHKGYVPWDDDIDIGMMRRDYDKFKKVVITEIKDKHLNDYLRIVLNMNKYKPLPMFQILHKDYNTILGGIDVFPYDFMDDINNCNAESYKKVQRSVFKNNRNGTPIESALGEYFDEFNISYDEKRYILPGIEGARSRFTDYNFNLFKREDIFPLRKLEFENVEYFAPNNYDEYLTQTFGSYMSIPRVIHHHHHRFERLAKRDDVIEIFEKNIKLLRDANSNF